jgi:hypothetical protein
LTEHREALDRLAQALLQEEVLERDQVLAIVHGGRNAQDGTGNEQATQKTLKAFKFRLNGRQGNPALRRAA